VTKLRVVVFDFDGVIVQSNHLKRQAYFEVFSPEAGPLVESVLLRHREKTRHQIIERVLEGLPATGSLSAAELASEVERYAGLYNDIVETGATQCPEMPGASRALEELHKHLPLYINSATPQEPLRRIVAARGLAGFFRRVLGVPASKIDNLGKVLDMEGVSGRAALVVGDGRSDWEAARRFGCRFVGVQNEFNNLDNLAPLRADLAGLAPQVLDMI
jgi:phosphoglycolate phosphatase